MSGQCHIRHNCKIKNSVKFVLKDIKNGFVRTEIGERVSEQKVLRLFSCKIPIYNKKFEISGHYGQCMCLRVLQ